MIQCLHAASPNACSTCEFSNQLSTLLIRIIPFVGEGDGFLICANSSAMSIQMRAHLCLLCLNHASRYPSILPVKLLIIYCIRLHNSRISHSTHHKIARPTSMPEPRNAVFRSAAPLGTFPVSSPPRYQLPMSVSFPSCVSMAEFGPTLDTSDRKAPKYE